MLFLILSLYVLTVIAMFVVTVRTGPDGRAVVVWARRRPARATARPMPPPAVPFPAVPFPAVPTPAVPTPAVPAPAVRTSAVRPESLEGMLAALLIAGEITGCQYRLAVEELAAQDEAGHPLTVPPDPGPASA